MTMTDLFAMAVIACGVLAGVFWLAYGATAMVELMQQRRGRR